MTKLSLSGAVCTMILCLIALSCRSRPLKMSVNVEVLAKLARIALEATDHEKIKRKVDQVLESFNQLNRVNTEGVEPFFHASPEMDLREDTPEAPLAVEELMKNAPDSSENCFRLPKVVGEIE